MKTILNKTLYKASILFFFLFGYAAHALEPCPPNTDCPPPGDDLPIGENISILIFMTILFGLYIIYNYKLNKKRPI
jgi:hypothetical protein